MSVVNDSNSKLIVVLYNTGCCVVCVKQPYCHHLQSNDSQLQLEVHRYTLWYIIIIQREREKKKSDVREALYIYSFVKLKKLPALPLFYLSSMYLYIDSRPYCQCNELLQQQQSPPPSYTHTHREKHACMLIQHMFMDVRAACEKLWTQ